MSKTGFIPTGVELTQVTRHMPDISDDLYTIHPTKYIDVVVEVHLRSSGNVSGATKETIGEAVFQSLPEIIEVKNRETGRDKIMRSIAESRIKSMEQELKKLKSFVNNLKR